MAVFLTARFYSNPIVLASWSRLSRNSGSAILKSSLALCGIERPLRFTQPCSVTTIWTSFLGSVTVPPRSFGTTRLTLPPCAVERRATNDQTFLAGFFQLWVDLIRGSGSGEQDEEEWLAVDVFTWRGHLQWNTRSSR